MQVEGDLDGLEQALGRKTPSTMFGSGSCSALVKLLPGNKDLLVSHDTWGTYNSMLRLFKFYNLPFHIQPGKGMTNKKAEEPFGESFLMFFPNFDVFCNSLLNKWNLFV